MKVTASAVNRDSIKVTFVSDYSLKKLIRSEISFKKISDRSGEKNDDNDDVSAQENQTDQPQA